MALTIYHYPRCSTCQKALAWLRQHGTTFTEVDLVTTPPTAPQLAAWQRASGKPLSAFFNTSGQSYRNGRFKERLATMTEAEKLAALAADGKLVKRPILVREHHDQLQVAIGFREAEFRPLIT